MALQARLSITGRVQGVGYRDWLVETAQRLRLSGWVRNRLDGSVEAVIVGDDGTERHFGAAEFAVDWQPGSRRIAKMTADLGSGRSLLLAPAGPVFAMSGLGYTHPLWGHGLDHGPELAVAHDRLDEAGRGWGNPLAMHIQALVAAELTDGDSVHKGTGVLEQLFVGPHSPTGLTGPMDPAT